MDAKHACSWVTLSPRRVKILVSFDQPLTATQLAERTGLTLDTCLHHLWTLRLRGILYCLNEGTRFSRVHWLTSLGEKCQNKFLRNQGETAPERRCPDIPWDVYSSVCYRHRAAVIKALREPAQAATVRRLAVFRDEKLRMSANNTRDVFKYLTNVGVTKKLVETRRGHRHPKYELTEMGRAFQKLLLMADLGPPVTG